MRISEGQIIPAILYLAVIYGENTLGENYMKLWLRTSKFEWKAYSIIIHTNKIEIEAGINFNCIPSIFSKTWTQLTTVIRRSSLLSFSLSHGGRVNEQRIMAIFVSPF